MSRGSHSRVLASNHHRSRFLISFRRSRCVGILLAGYFCLSGQSVVQADSEIDLIRRYYEALRSRSMFVLAEEAASRAVTQSNLSTESRVEITFQQAMTFFEHGAVESGTSRTEYWNAARDIVTRWLAEHPQSIRHEEMEAWLSTLTTLEAEVLVRDALLTPEDLAGREAAKAKLRQAVSELHPNAAKFGKDAPFPKADTRPQSVLIRERERLRQENRYFLALTESYLAELEPIGHNRTGLLMSASQQADSITRGGNDDGLGTEVLLLKARLARLQGDEKRALVHLTSSTLAEKSREELDSLLAERIQLELSRQQLGDAFDLLKERLERPETPSDALRATIIQALLAYDATIPRTEGSGTESDYIKEAKRQVSQTRGRWRREATIRFDRAKQDQSFGPKLANTVRQATAAWQSGQINEAAQLFTAASNEAREAKQVDNAFTFGLTAISLLIQGEHWNELISFSEQLAAIAPDHPKAIEVDLLKCYAIGRIDSKSQRFQDALKKHIQQYPNSSTRWDAVRMLGVHEELLNHHVAALEFYQQIPADHASREETDLRSLQLVETLQAGPTALDPSQSSTIQTVLNSIIHRRQGASESWTATQAKIMFQCVRLLMGSPSNETQVHKILDLLQRRIIAVYQESLKRGEAVPKEWAELRETTAQLRIISLAGRNQFDEARTHLESLQSTEPEFLLTVLTGLNELATQLPQEKRYELGHLQLQTIRGIQRRRSELNPQQQLLLDEANAKACIAVANWSGAIAAYEELVKAAPDDPKYFKPLIEVLQKQGLPADLQRALQLLKRQESLSAKGSPAWIECRVDQATLLKQSGETDAARKLLGVTRTLYPVMGSPALRDRSNALWNSLNPK
ncbi:hypothetical protein [Planctomicrobium sp. SH527]|uniref:hypothetical protein n=1 Tax=Planctomicrobium sp. SH527 TaxID=3448123 RepID=UPI003F5C7D0D